MRLGDNDAVAAALAPARIAHRRSAAVSRAERDQPQRQHRERRARKYPSPRKLRSCCGWSRRHSRAPGARAERGCVPRRAGSAAAATRGEARVEESWPAEFQHVLRLVAATQPRSGSARGARLWPAPSGISRSGTEGRGARGRILACRVSARAAAGRGDTAALRCGARANPSRRFFGDRRLRTRSLAAKLTDREIAQPGGRRHGCGAGRLGWLGWRRRRVGRGGTATHDQGQECGERKEFFHRVNSCGLWR